MKMRPGRGRARGLLVAVLVGIVWGHAPGAWACSCVSADDADQFRSAEVVFIGTVTGRDDPNQGEQVQSTGDQITWTFDVHSAQKGQVFDPAEVDSARGEPTCGFVFQHGQRYQVYAERADGGLQTNSCMGTRSLADQRAYTPAGEEGQVIVAGSRLAKTGVQDGILTAMMLLIGAATIVTFQRLRRS